MKKTVKVLIIFISIFVVLYFSGFMTHAEEKPLGLSDVVIDNTFPDNDFRKYIKYFFDDNKDGILSPSEIAKVTEIDLMVYVDGDMLFVYSLDGIEVFYNLRSLDGSVQSFEKVALDGFQKLERVDVGYGCLSSIEIKNCPCLKYIGAENCYDLRTFTLSNCPSVTEIDLSGTNYIEEVNFSQLSNLETLNLQQADVKKINVSSNKKLKVLYAGMTKITSIDVSNNSELMVLNLVNDTIDSLNLSNNPKLKELVAPKGLSSINLSNNRALEELSIEGISSINIGYCPLLKYLSISGISSLNISNNPKLIVAYLNYDYEEKSGELIYRSHGKYRSDEWSMISYPKNATIITDKPIIEPTGLGLNYDSLTLEKGQNRSLIATVVPDNASDKTVTYISGNTSVASVDSNGLVKAVGQGNTTITAKTVNGIEKSIPIKVVVKPTKISLNISSSTIYFGDSLTLTATLSPSDVTEKTITWASSNVTVATVSGGVVKAKGAGKATITAKTVNGLTAKCEVSVFADNVSSNIFADIKFDSWQYNAAKAVFDKGYMTGTGTLGGRVLFSPNNNINRTMFVQALYSMDGKPAVTYVQKFSDVNSGAWYASAVTWASNNGIVAGNPDNSFGVNGKATREQLALMFYKYAVYKKYDVGIKATTNLDGFTDAKKVDSWALTAVKWAVERGIISGKGNASAGYRIDPTGKASRVECAAMMNKFSEVYSGAPKMCDEDLEESIALPMEEVEDIPVPGDETEDVADDEEPEVIDDGEEIIEDEDKIDHEDMIEDEDADSKDGTDDKMDKDGNITG